MKTIHLLGSEGFIGRAVQRGAAGITLHCWSHSHSDPNQYFDLIDRASWQSLLSSRPTTLILLSWPGLPNYQNNFHITQNLPACIDLVEQLVQVGLRRIVVAGTCYEYGLQNGALKEDQLPDPINSYAIAKDCLRRAIASYCNSKNVSWSWLRIFYPYGLGQNPKSLLPALSRAIDQGCSVFPMSSGRQLRDYIPVEEVARQLLLLASHPEANGVYNGGSGQPRSLREIVEARINELDSQISLDCGVYPDREDEPLAFWADMNRLHNLSQSSLFSS